MAQVAKFLTEDVDIPQADMNALPPGMLPAPAPLQIVNPQAFGSMKRQLGNSGAIPPMDENAGSGLDIGKLHILNELNKF